MEETQTGIELVSKDDAGRSHELAWKGNEIWARVPPCFRGAGVVDGRVHVATVLDPPSSPNPGLRFVGSLGMDGVEAVCRFVRQWCSEQQESLEQWAARQALLLDPQGWDGVRSVLANQDVNAKPSIGEWAAEEGDWSIYARAEALIARLRKVTNDLGALERALLLEEVDVSRSGRGGGAVGDAILKLRTVGLLFNLRGVTNLGLEVVDLLQDDQATR